MTDGLWGLGFKEALPSLSISCGRVVENGGLENISCLHQAPLCCCSFYGNLFISLSKVNVLSRVLQNNVPRLICFILCFCLIHIIPFTLGN